MLFLFQALNEICVESEVYPEEEEEETGGGSLLRYHVFVNVFRCAQDKQNLILNNKNNLLLNKIYSY